MFEVTNLAMKYFYISDFFIFSTVLSNLGMVHKTKLITFERKWVFCSNKIVIWSRGVNSSFSAWCYLKHMCYHHTSYHCICLSYNVNNEKHLLVFMFMYCFFIRIIFAVTWTWLIVFVRWVIICEILLFMCFGLWFFIVIIYVVTWTWHIHIGRMIIIRVILLFVCFRLLNICFKIMS